MWLIAGLGNPGPKYELTRHNFGFLLLDRLLDHYGFPEYKKSLSNFLSKHEISSKACVLLKPQTFMNRSGQAVLPAMQFFKIKPQKLIILHDDLDLKLGELRIKQNGGNGGHNGLKDISARIGSDFFRIRLGIGRPNFKGSEADYVLKPFTNQEFKLVEEVLTKGALAIEALITNGLESAQQGYQVKIS